MINAFRSGACTLGILALTPVASAADLAFSTLVIEGQDVPSVGLVTSIENLAVNDSGHWIVECDTDHPDGDADGVLIRDGVLYLRHGQSLLAPPGAAISSFDSVNINNAGHSGWNFFLDNTPTSADSGIFLDAVLVLQEGTRSAAEEFSPETHYIGFFESRINAANDLMVMASVDDPFIPSTVDRAIVRIVPNPAGGIVGETVLAKEGDILPGQSEPVADFLTGPHNLAFNNAGQVMYVADLSGDTARDNAIYVNFTLVAQEGLPAPVAGRNWAGLGSAMVDLNDAGQFVHTGTLDGDAASNAVIVKSGGTIVRQEGDPFGTAAFTGFGSAPVFLSNQGRVLWYGAWNEPNTASNEALFLDDLILVREGSTQIDGVTVQTIRSGQDAFTMSDSGRYIVFEAVLADGREGAFQIELSYCPGSVAADPQTDLNDLAVILSAFGSCNGSARYLPEADFDFSGCIELGDLAVLLSHFGSECPL